MLKIAKATFKGDYDFHGRNGRSRARVETGEEFELTYDGGEVLHVLVRQTGDAWLIPLVYVQSMVADKPSAKKS